MQPVDPKISSQLAHELRSPLAAVIGTIDALVDTSTTLEPEERAELLMAARSEAEHLLALVEQARGRGEAMRPVVLAEVARRVLERFPQVEARTYLQMDRTVTAWTDPDRIDQILTNILQNVQRYAPVGDVEIGLADRGSHVELTCQDNGPGVPSDKAEKIFVQGGSQSEHGLHIGLALSRRLARDLGGDLVLLPDETGAAFRLSLPGARSGFADAAEPRVRGSRMKLLVDLAGSLTGRSLSRVESGLSRLGTELFGASSVHLLLLRDGHYVSPSGRAGTSSPLSARDPVFERLQSERWLALDATDARWWPELTETPHGIVVKLESGQAAAILTLGWHRQDRDLIDTEALHALTVIAGLAVERAVLTTELENERLLRATVMESLPIAVSIFAGDPPVVIDQNRAELQMLGLVDPEHRPSGLDTSQRTFDVRFADGTPLTVDNAPVTEAIRQGRATGPFFLRVRRSDGTEVITRTYCAPFASADRGIAGAVVTSEPISGEWVDRARTD